MRALFVSLFCCLCVLFSSLGRGAELSYAYAIDDGEVQGEHADRSCVAMSTFKVYVALAVLKSVDEKILRLDSDVLIAKEEWEQETWSPLQKLYRGQDASFSLSSLLEAMLVQSDNIATDALIDQLGGVEGVNAVLASMGMRDITFFVNEREMQVSVLAASQNRFSPRQMIETLRLLRKGELLSKSSTQLMLTLMHECQTGKEKIRAQFPDAYVANRSGGSGRDAVGVVLADNDVGFALLPDGRCLYIAIFINRSSASDAEHRSMFKAVCSLPLAGE